LVIFVDYSRDDGFRRTYRRPRVARYREDEEKPGDLTVARDLRPEDVVVPVRNRPELDELLRWCASEGHAAVRLVVGDEALARLALRCGSGRSRRRGLASPEAVSEPDLSD
jgi:hypothetical protein